MATSTPRLHPEGNKVAFVCTSLTICMILLVTARIYTRVRIVKSFGADDILLIAGAILCALLLPGILIGIYKYEFGYTPGTALPASMAGARVITYIHMILLQLGLGFTKASLMLTVKRFARSSLVYIYIIHTMIVAVLLFCIISTLIMALGCKPIHAGWMYVAPGPEIRCGYAGMYLIMMYIHMATDFITLILPMPLLFRLRVPQLQRTFLIFLFTLGSFSVAGSFLRLIAIKEGTKQIPWNYLSLGAMLWAVVEADVAIICGCLPPLNAFIRYFIYGQVPRRPPTPEPMTPRPTRPSSFVDPLSSSSQAINQWSGSFIWDRSPSSSRRNNHSGSYNLDDDIELSSFHWEETHSSTIRRRIDREEEHGLQNRASNTGCGCTGHSHDSCKAPTKHDPEKGTMTHRTRESSESPGSERGRRSRSASPSVLRIATFRTGSNRPSSCGDIERRRKNVSKEEEE